MDARSKEGKGRLSMNIDEAIDFVASKKFPEIESLNELQRKALNAIMSRKDVFAILPTGFGKSLIFQLVPDICCYLNSRGFSYPKQPIVVVICPLSPQHLFTRGLSSLRFLCISTELKYWFLNVGSSSFITDRHFSIFSNFRWHGKQMNADAPSSHKVPLV